MSLRLLDRFRTSDFAQLQTLQSGARFVLLLLCILADETTLEACPGVPRLTVYAGFGERQVRRYLQELAGKGFIEVVQRTGGRSNFATYRVTIGVPATNLFDGPH